MKEKDKYFHNLFPETTEKTFRYAYALRKQMTKQELILWSRLRVYKQSIDGFRFRRHHPYGPFILDNYCHQAKLAIEIDGGYHKEKEQIPYDLMRTDYLKERSVEVIRFENGEVENELDNVVNFIEAKVKERIAQLRHVL